MLNQLDLPLIHLAHAAKEERNVRALSRRAVTLMMQRDMGFSWDISVADQLSGEVKKKSISISLKVVLLPTSPLLALLNSRQQ